MCYRIFLGKAVEGYGVCVGSIFTFSFSLDVRKQFAGGKYKTLVFLWIDDDFTGFVILEEEGSKYRSILSRKVLSRSFCSPLSLYEEIGDPEKFETLPLMTQPARAIAGASDPLREGTHFGTVQHYGCDYWFFLQADASCSCVPIKIGKAGTTLYCSVRFLYKQIF